MSVAGSDLICLGAIAGAYGVRGEVRLKSFCAVPESIADYGPLVTEDGHAFDVTLTRPISGAYAARLSGVTTKEAADALKGVRLHVARERMPPPDEDEYYHADLIGVAVYDTGGVHIGAIKAVQDHGAGDILEVSRPGLAELLVPFTRTAVPTVDLGAGRIIVDPPEDDA